jgi:photosystem II stability/assembly factor-like uncharacterized protein
MKIIYFKWLLLVLPFVIWGLSTLDQQKKIQKPEQFRTASSMGVTNAQDRMSWEFDRLKDPATNTIPANMRQRELIFASQLPSDKYSLLRSVFWTARGPYNVGGRTRAFSADIRNENILLAGGVSGGVWRSVDGGSNWYKTTQPDALHSVTCLVQDSRNGKNDTWYMGTGELLGNSASAPGAYFYGNGLCKSTDNGLTWQPVASTTNNTPTALEPWDLVWNIALDPSTDTADIMYAATYGTIYRSADAGSTWKAVLGGNTSAMAYYTDIAVSASGKAYATLSYDGNNKGIWRSANGIDWVNLTPSSFPSGYERMVMAINPSNENELYLLAQTPNYGKKTLNYYGDADWNSLWKYTYLRGDGKDTNGVWVNLSNNLPSDGTSKFDNYQSQGGYDLVITVKPDDSNVVFIGGTNLYRSTDGFSTPNHIMQIGGYGIHTTRPNWKLYPNSHPDHHVMFFSKFNPDILYNGCDGGIFKSTDCLADTVSWMVLNNGYQTTQTYAVSVDQTSSNDIIVAGFQDNGNRYTSKPDQNTIWNMPYNGDGSYSAIAPDSEFYVLSVQNGRLQKMKIDGDGNRTQFTRIDPIGGKDYQFVNPFVLDPNDKNILYLAGGKVLWRQNRLSEIPMNGSYDSISFGWQTLNPAFPLTSWRITALAVSKTPANRVYLGTNKGEIYRIDNANTGIPVPVRLTSTNTVFPALGNISCIAIDPTNADKVAVVFSNYNVYSLFYTADGGTTWKKAAGNLEENNDGTGNGPSLRWLSILPYKGKTLYCLGTSVGLFATASLADDSVIWKQLGANSIGNVVVEMVVSREKDGLILVATHGTGIFSTHINSVDEVLSMFEPRNNIKTSISLYPNPASDYVFIRFNLDKTQLAQIIVYDQLGRDVLHPWNGSLPQGNNELKINTSTLKKGTYYIGIKGNSINSSKCFVVN